MPPFDFQLSDETQRLLDAIMRQSQQAQLAQTEQAAQPVQQPAELPDAKQQIDNAVLGAANPQRPSYLLPPVPHPLQNEYEQAILAQKLAYAAAEKQYKAAQDEATRQGLLANMEEINRAANSTREIGTAAGIDLSNVGEGVSLQDAMKNLATQRAQSFTEMATGRYSMTADQFWQSEYDRHRMAGVSDEGARRSASRAAREYQAKRVAYLNQLYNNYGRDGLVTNELGNQIILGLAADSPTSANFYGQIYPNAKDAYKRQNEIEDAERAQSYTRSNKILNALLEDQRASNADARGRATFGYQQDILYANEISKKQFEKAHENLKPNDVEKIWQEGLAFAQINGYTGLDAIQVARQYATRKVLADGKGKGTDKSGEQMQARYNSLVTREKNLTDRLEKASTDEERQEIQKELAGVRTMIKDMDTKYSQVYGAEAARTIPPYTGKPEQDIKTAKTILGMLQKNNPNATREQIIQSFKDWIKDKDSAAPDMPDWAIEKWVDEVVYGKKGTTPQETAPQTPRQGATEVTESAPRKPNDKPVGKLPWEQASPLNQFNPQPQARPNLPSSWDDSSNTWDDYRKHYGYYHGWSR